jgi:hypothetical protein
MSESKKKDAQEKWEDPIVAEMHAIREAHAEKFGYDLDAIFEDFKAFEQTLKKKLVKRSPKLVRKEPA